jgi:hypothetical protein
MGRLAKVGQDKLLTGLSWVVPLLGTTSMFAIVRRGSWSSYSSSNIKYLLLWSFAAIRDLLLASDGFVGIFVGIVRAPTRMVPTCSTTPVYAPPSPAKDR